MVSIKFESKFPESCVIKSVQMYCKELNAFVTCLGFGWLREG